MTKYVAKAVPEKGWRIWDRKMKKWWGNYFREYPQELLDELNGERRSDEIVNLCRISRPSKKYWEGNKINGEN